MAPCLLRLQDARPAVRRIAVLDLLRIAADPSSSAHAQFARGQIADALCDALQRETDPIAAGHLIRGLGEAGRSRHMPALVALRDSTQTPPQLAHDALLAADRIKHRELSDTPRVS